MYKNLNYYLNIQSSHESGTSKEARLQTVKNMLNNDFEKTLDCYEAVVGGEMRDLTILKTVNIHIKKIKSRPNETFYAGQYVVWQNVFWLITEVDAADDIITYGKMEQCNYLLKWQNDEGGIIERWAIISSVSKYNDGTTGNKTITLGSDQLCVSVPVDEDTIKLKKSMSKKFFIDNNKSNPTTYELTETVNVTSSYDGHGITDWIVKETPYTPTDEELDIGVCGYMNPKEETDIPSGELVNAQILGSTYLKIGIFQIYRVKFIDGNGNTLDDIDYEWNIEGDCAADIDTTIQGYGIKLQVDNEDCMGQIIDLQILVGNVKIASMKIEIEGVF